jgi:CRISPR-associated protein Cas6
VYWQDEQKDEEFAVPDDVVDLAFGIRCPTLPNDHAQALSDEVRRVLTWFEDEPSAGLHTVHGAESGNGWERPEGAGSTLYLSRRTKLVLRLPKERVDDAKALVGATLQVAGHPLVVTDAHPRLLSASTTLYARHVTFGTADQGEAAFMQRVAEEFRAGGFRIKKVLCGKTSLVVTANGPVMTRSLMVADLRKEEAVRLQQQGLGPMRKLGCGLFIAHKSV